MNAFALQALILDLLAQEHLRDGDGFAIRAARALMRVGVQDEDLAVRALGRVRTNAFGARRSERTAITQRIVRRLAPRIRGGVVRSSVADPIPRSIPKEVRLRRSASRTDRLVLQFSAWVERDGIDQFWDKRSSGVLRKHPEMIGKGLLGAYLSAALTGKGSVLQEVRTGIGFVDLMIYLQDGAVSLLELKVARTRTIGHQQVAEYARLQGHDTAWLVVFDAQPTAKPERPHVTKSVLGTIEIREIHISINPGKPSSLDRRMRAP